MGPCNTIKRTLRGKTVLRFAETIVANQTPLSSTTMYVLDRFQSIYMQQAHHGRSMRTMSWADCSMDAMLVRYCLPRTNIRRRRCDDHDHDVTILMPRAWRCDRLPT
jgi:hypothetical protein